MSIYLYIKRHKVTGLKYFGKTKRSDPYSYQGSGLYWNKHLNKHGRNKNLIETVCVWEFTDQEECTKFALKFSEENNIVNSNEWANLREENGKDGGDTSRFREYKPLSEESKQKMIKSKLGKTPWNKGKKTGIGGNKNPKTDEQKQKLSKALKGKPNPASKGTVGVVDINGSSFRVSKEEFLNNPSLVAIRSKEGQRRILATSSACS